MPEQVTKRFYNWASILDPQAREQAERTASMPFIYPHLALMPDAHHVTRFNAHMPVINSLEYQV